jgi:hypothetical protein
MGGSRVRFTPPAEWMADNIAVHEPHPTHRIRSTDARGLGRRLENHYGFDSKIFVLRGG